MEFDYTKEPGKKLLSRDLDHRGEPLVSIITPYYNAGKYFEQTFNCVMNQTFPWFEWIIVDDGSTERDSMEALQRLAVKDDRIQVIRQENKGLSAARNAGVSASNTDIFIPLDADDLIAPTYVEETFFGLQKNPEAAWAYTDTVGFGDQEYLWKKRFSSERMKTENLLVCTAAVRKKWWEKVGGYDVVGHCFNEDWHFWLKFIAEGGYPIHISGCLFWYRRRASGMQKTVQHDAELKRKNKEIINKTIGSVNQNVVAKEYPSHGSPGKYIKPCCSEFDRKARSKHEKIHVLMLIPWMEMGGADLFNLDICSRIDKERFEIGIITTQQGENSWQQRFSEHVTDIFNLPDFLDVENWAEFISYYIKSREVDVLFLSNSYYGYYLVPWLRKEFPDLAIIDYVHMEEWYWRNGGYARTSGAMGDILEKTYVCNERTRRVLINDFGRDPESVKTLYIGVDKDKYNENTVEAGIAKKQLGISADRPMVLFPCRIHPQKRPFLMPEIAKEVKKRIPDIAFTVVGDGPQFDELKNTIDHEKLTDIVYLAGRQSDMRPWYKDSALTLICSLKEGLALTAYESLSMGRPVVTSDVGGQAELIDATVGRVLPLMQSEEMDLDSRDFSGEEIRQYADAIVDILSDREQYAEMSKACRKRIEEGFSSQIMIQKFETILSNMISDISIINERHKKAASLGIVRSFVDESVSCYQRLASKENENQEVWKSREWFRERYEGAINRPILTEETVNTDNFKGFINLADATVKAYETGTIGMRYIPKFIRAWVFYKIKHSR